MFDWLTAVSVTSSLLSACGLLLAGRPPVRPIERPQLSYAIYPSVTPGPVRAKVMSPTQTPTFNGLTQAVNRYRTEHGLTALTTGNTLCRVVDKRCGEIAGDFSHAGFTEAVAGIPHLQAAENIWRGNGNEQTVVVAWDGSEAHRQNLQGSWQRGCGCLRNGKAVFVFIGN